MSKIKRLRIFAGPNGSGKSTLFEEFSRNYNTGFFINADTIEKTIAERGFIDLEDYAIKATQTDWNTFLSKKNTKSLVEKSEKNNHKIDVEIRENMIVDRSKKTHSYEGSIVAMFLREKLMESHESFSFETVMSHPSKLKEITKANMAGYKTYLYFVCIDDPEVNISRIDNRIHKGGHYVDNTKVVKRYPRTLENLYDAILLCNKTYLFDNSGDELIMIAEIQEDTSLKLHVNQNKFPNWFKKYVLNHYL